MNVVYVNLSPQKISNEQIHSFLSELVDGVLLLRKYSTIFIKNAEDQFPGAKRKAGIERAGGGVPASCA